MTPESKRMGIKALKLLGGVWFAVGTFTALMVLTFVYTNHGAVLGFIAAIVTEGIAAVGLLPFFMIKEKLICTRCYAICTPKTKVAGSLLVELFLWCFILPGIIYSIFRSSSRYKACRICGSPQLIPLDSPRGLELAQRPPGEVV